MTIATKRARAVLGSLVAGCLLVAAAAASEDPAPPPPNKGMRAASIETGVDPLILGDISPSIGLDDEDFGEPLIFPRSRFAANGVSLRNCCSGGISVVGIPPGSHVLKAYLFWTWTALDAPTHGLHDRMKLTRIFPEPNDKEWLQGTLIGSGGDPCWGGANNFTYRAEVTTQDDDLATGGGLYLVEIPQGSAGSMDYSDPWGYPNAPSNPPLIEGATLVIVYRNNVEPLGTTVIYDLGLAGQLFYGNPGLGYALVGFPPVSEFGEARWCNIGADGQTGNGYATGPAGSSWESTFELNTFTLIAGGGPVLTPSNYNDSDWNGCANKPLGQLWDTSGHDVTFELQDQDRFPVIFSTFGAGNFSDCLVGVANVMWTR